MTHTITPTCTGCTACARICPTQAISGVRGGLHVIEPARCIDCGACGRICPVEAVEDAGGETCRQVKRSLWAKPVICTPAGSKKQKAAGGGRNVCIGCGICVQACPVDCLALTVNQATAVDLTAYAALVEPKKCIACAFCADECPVGAIAMGAA